LENRWLHFADYKIRLYETDETSRLTFSALCAFLEETANHHAVRLGYSVREMLKNGITWVLLRFEVRLLGDMPSEGETVTVKTWPLGLNRLFFRRDFQVSANGRPFACAATEWTVFDINSRKTIAIPREMTEELTPPSTEKAIETLNWKLAAAEEAPVTAAFTVRKTDIDRNGHVNNVRYIDWLLEAANRAEKDLLSVTVVYRAEALYGEDVSVRTSVSGEKEVLQGIFNSSGKELIRAKILFR
jgi:acyl-ACP thioesterase